MRLITRFEAATRSTAALYRLRRQAFEAFSAAARGSQAQRNALTSMRHIEAELATRAYTP